MARAKERDALAKAMAAMDPVDGAVEISETKEVCWRCAAKDELHCLGGLIVHCICGERRRKAAVSHLMDEQDPAWNNV